MGLPGWCRFPSLVAATIAVLSSSVPLSHAQAFDAIHSLVLLESNQSSSAAACVAVQVAHDRLLTSHSCDAASLTTARFVHDASDDNRFTSTQMAQDVLWTDSKSMQVLSFTRDIDGGGNRKEASVKPLALPPADVQYPTQLSVDHDASILELDLDTLELTIIHDVIFVDKSLCIPESEEEDDASTLHGGEAAICVAPANVDDRVVKESPAQPRRVGRFLVKHEGAKGKGNHVLLGLGIRRNDDGADDHDAFHLFSWLGTTLLNQAFASSVGITPRKPESLSFDRIVGGQVVNKIDPTNEFIAGLRLGPFGESFCTGSLIGKRYILTAAHCMVGKEYAWVTVGALQQEGITPEILLAIKVIRHPQYKSGAFSYDFAILELTSSSTRKPIPLLSAAPKEITKATVFGYGAINDNATVDTEVLRSVELPLGISNDKCQKVMGTTIDDSMICAGGQKGKDSCNGDSGGPLVIHPGTNKQQLLGLVSFGSTPCGLAGVYGVYGSVPAAISFLGPYARRAKNPVPRPPDGVTIRPGRPPHDVTIRPGRPLPFP